MKHTTLALAAALLALGGTTSQAQTYKTDFSTGIVLAGGGTNTGITTSLKAGTGLGSLTFTLPNNIPVAPAGYFLTTALDGTLSWASSSSSLLLPTNNIFVGNGSGVATAYAPINSSVLVTDASGNVSWGTTLPGVTIGQTGASGTPLTIANTGTGLADVTGTGGTWNVSSLGAGTFTSLNAGSGAISTTGTLGAGATTVTSLNAGSGTIQTTGAVDGATGTFTGAITGGSGASLDAAPNTGGTVTIGNNTAGLGDSSTTTINGNVSLTGAVTFAGPVTIPAGAINLGLADDKFFIGGSDGNAHAQTISQDVAITDAGVATVSAAHGDFAVGGNSTVTGTLGAGATTVASLNAGSGAITTTGTLGAGATTVTSLNAGSGTIQTTGAVDGATGTFTGAITGGSGASLDAAPNTGGTVTIGNNTAGLGDSSTTTINGNVSLTGAVTFAGPVTIPAGAINLGLADDKFFIGGSDGNAHAQTITQDVAITDAGVATVSAAHGDFAVGGNSTVTGTLGVTAQTTLGSTALSSATVAAADPLVLNTSHSTFVLTSAAPTTVSSISGANTVAGQIIVLINTSANNVTLHSNGTLVLNGGDVIMGPGGTATLMSDGTNWRLTGAQ